ncbi:MAG TPA: hypothetical protein VL595_11555 [Pseudonocardia sp.]|jgi:hypothetical protein|nr:hypothetical protein [Pseudonocardia sp.]
MIRSSTLSHHPLPLAVCGALLLAGMWAAAPAYALDFPAPPPSFGGPGGCTTVTPGGDMLCLWVDDAPARPPLFVTRVRAVFTPSHPATLPACDTHYELTYYRDGLAHTDRADQFGCQPSADTPAGADFALNTRLDLDKPICTRTRGPLTAGLWTQRTCVTIHQDSSDVGNT